MRTIITAALLAAALTLAGCRSESPVTETTELSFVSANTVEASAEGGSYTVEYTVHNPSEDGVFSHECQAEWITGIKTGQNIMTFTVPANTAEEARQDGIVIIYDYISGKDSLTVNVTQAGIEPEPEPEPFSAEFKLGEITWNSANITIIPNNPDAVYLTGYCKKDQYESFSSDEEIFIHRLNELVWSIQAPEEIISIFGRQGEDTAELSDLTGNTEYVFYAFSIGLDESDNPVLLSEVFDTQFTTPEQALTDFRVVLQLDLNGTSLNITATPSDKEQYYYLKVMDSFQLYGISGETVEEQLRQYVKNNVANWLDFGFAADVSGIDGVRQGDYSDFITDLIPGTQYIAFAVGVNDEGYADSEISMEIFTPEAVAGDAEVTYTPRCFDGTEVASMYPDQYGQAMGRILVVFEKEFTESTAGYKWTVYPGDYSYLSEPDIVYELSNWGQEGNLDESRYIHIVNNGDQFTLMLAAYDSNYNYGKASATVYSFTREDALPIEQFVP